MTLSDGRCSTSDLDPDYDGLLAVSNTDQEPKEIDIGITGLELHHILQDGADSVVRSASVQSNTVTEPPITSAVFVKPQSGDQGEFPCNPVVK